MPGFPDGASVDIETTAGLAYLVTVFAAPPTDRSGYRWQPRSGMRFSLKK